MTKRYRMRETAKETKPELAGYSELARHLLLARGIEDAENAEKFLAPNYLNDSHDPFLLPDMDKAVERLLGAARAHEHIAVWSDYDCDGIPGGVALAEFLREIGCTVDHYIPHRHEEGYGLNGGGIDTLGDGGIKLIVTVDLGTSDIAHIARAKEKGIEIIVTDHHLVGDDVSEAIAFINPHRKDSEYPFPDLCGSGVAWKLIQAILSQDRFGMAEGKEKWLLDLVGLATLSDMVPLVGENRMLASYGLLVMRKTKRPGLKSLLKLLRIDQRTLSEDDVAFMVTPRINAASRMAHPSIAAHLLATHDADEGAELARELNHINDERKGTVAAIVKEARHRLHETSEEEKKSLIVMGSTKWRPGVLGLVANSLADSECVPVFLWGREGGDLLKGSCRSDGNINVVELMRGAADLFEDFGGHEFSGGFSIKQERAVELGPRLIASYEKLLLSSATEREVIVDKELPIEEVSRALREIKRFAPFGVGNPKPLFMLSNVTVSRIRQFGKANDHLEIFFSKSGSEIAGVSFFSGVDSFSRPLTADTSVNVVAHLESDFRGRPRLRVVDVL